MWEDSQELKRWFDRVRAKRGMASGVDDIPDDEDMSDNELAAIFKGDR
jgi:hypothetical protein